MSTRLSSAFEEGYQKIKNQQAMSPDASGKTTISDLEVIDCYDLVILLCYGRYCLH